MIVAIAQQGTHTRAAFGIWNLIIAHTTRWHSVKQLPTVTGAGILIFARKPGQADVADTTTVATFIYELPQHLHKFPRCLIFHSTRAFKELARFFKFDQRDEYWMQSVLQIWLQNELSGEWREERKKRKSRQGLVARQQSGEGAVKSVELAIHTS